MFFFQAKSTSEAFLMNTHNACFREEITKNIYPITPLIENFEYHYENKPIQIYWKFHLQKLNIFR